MAVFHPADAVYNELIMETGSQMDFVSSHKVRQKEGERVWQQRGQTAVSRDRATLFKQNVAQKLEKEFNCATASLSEAVNTGSPPDCVPVVLRGVLSRQDLSVCSCDCCLSAVLQELTCTDGVSQVPDVVSSSSLSLHTESQAQVCLTEDSSTNVRRITTV